MFNKMSTRHAPNLNYAIIDISCALPHLWLQQQLTDNRMEKSRQQSEKTDPDSLYCYAA